MKVLKIILIFTGIIFYSNTQAQTKVYITEKVAKYHKKECRLLSKTHKETTILKAKSKGYLACKICVPKEEPTGNKVVEKKETQKKSTVKKSIATRCTATTQKGTQCKRRTKNASGKCWQHE